MSALPCPPRFIADLKCPECGHQMELRVNRYKGGWFYTCHFYPQCPGSHGAHPDGKPLGVPADQVTKQARIRAHAAFDGTWKRFIVQGSIEHSKKIMRRRAYIWLQWAMGLSNEDAHIAKFNIAQCEKLISLIEAENL